MVLRLLSNVCVATLFYQLPEYHVYPFLRNLLYLIKVHSSTFISCHPIAAERGIVRLRPVRPKMQNKKSGLAFTNPDKFGRGDRI